MLDQSAVFNFLLQKKKVFVFVGIFIVISLIATIFLISQNNNKSIINNDLTKSPSISHQTTSTYPFNSEQLEKGYPIGKVNVTTNDLEDKFKIYFSDTPSNRQNILNWQKVAAIVNQDAILQDEYIKTGLSSSSDSKINPRVVVEAREYFDTKGTTYVSGEVFSVWFYNTEPPIMGLEQAKTKTKKIMDDLRNKVIQGQYTIKQAADIISGMTELKDIDFAYQTNSYVEFTYLKPTQFKFNDHDLDRQIWEMSPNTVSPVLVGKDYDGEKWYDAYYVVIKVTDKKTSPYSGADDLIKKKIQEGEKLSL